MACGPKLAYHLIGSGPSKSWKVTFCWATDSSLQKDLRFIFCLKHKGQVGFSFLNIGNIVVKHKLPV
ncbi:hypothetical protein Y1Q_0002862 [Alligator mississippiensis]|uniref:Uncharacterized protein n=1 Tax=Alligator mississippiensis TaxID=8496 RepID=A0A151P093_ALLMI|nr:hypothetical protein Y1Q_0002862 [Alligator mississippiensis]